MEIEPRANYIVLTLSIYHEELLMYICGWPNNFLNGQILAEVFGHMSTFSYFELCTITTLVTM